MMKESSHTTVALEEIENGNFHYTHMDDCHQLIACMKYPAMTLTLSPKSLGIVLLLGEYMSCLRTPSA